MLSREAIRHLGVPVVHVRGERRLATLLQLVGDESRELRPARDIVLERLLEVLLIEALRSNAGTAASPGLLRGLADGRLAAAIRRMHEVPSRPWTVAQLAKEAALVCRRQPAAGARTACDLSW